MSKPRPASAPILEKALRRTRGPLTVADAAAKAGLPLRDAEEGLRHLAAEFRGHLSATEKGELLYEFPKGLTRPPETRPWRRAVNALGRGIVGTGRFVVRAWVSVVMVTYAVGFAALLIAMAAKDDRDGGAGAAVGVVFRVIAEALYWTFHPFSPVSPVWGLGGFGGGFDRPARRQLRGPKVPFYEKVNRFVFGPPPPVRDPREEERRVLAEIRSQQGRVTPADVMRVTGQDREEAERLLLRLVVDYNGDIEVSEGGAILYRFSGLRVSAEDSRAIAPPPVWNEKVALRPLTGNSAGTNVLLGLVNGFNLAVSTYALTNDLTIERIGQMIERANERHPLPLPPADGMPLVLGLIPFVFSATMFALPLLRSMRRTLEERRVARQNGWRGVLKAVVEGRGGRVDVYPSELRKAWVAAGGGEPGDRDLEKAVRAAGGEVEIGEDGRIVYRFTEVEGERAAAEAARKGAGGEEARPGAVVFSSGDAGPGMREGAGAVGASVGAGAAAAAARPEPEDLPQPVSPKALPERQETLDDVLRRLGVDTRTRGR